ncbi:hypothetical protein CFAM422_009354 [Trichoderma lentiforme]|uniref:Uncharacterized protein n=1 Tax=Trichoderma lentiforme TaxID=1567552 RepID=A0A9P5CBJ8_9HYPO|nr:hypothetical protein CFAM422_009354 [Trichoderma lentiforme]
MSALFFDTTTQETHIVTKIYDCFTSMNEIKPLDSVMKATILDNTEALASQDLRVLALALQFDSQLVSASDVTDGNGSPRERFERDLVFHGVTEIFDPPGPEPKDNVLMCQYAGITTHAIATDVYIPPSSEKTRMFPADVAHTTMVTAQRV